MLPPDGWRPEAGLYSLPCDKTRAPPQARPKTRDAQSGPSVALAAAGGPVVRTACAAPNRRAVTLPDHPKPAGLRSTR
jgi:hypothetical protein